MQRYVFAAFRYLAIAVYFGMGTSAVVAQPYYIDDFLIIKNGNTFFHETFNEPGALPPPWTPPSFTCANPVGCYGVNGAFFSSDIAGGKLKLDPATFGSPSANSIGTPTLLQSATLLTNGSNSPADAALGLKRGTAFSVTGVFDLVQPGSGQYGIRLTDAGIGVARDVLDLRIYNNGGQISVRYVEQDFLASTFDVLDIVNLNTAGHDQIALTLSHLANTNAITASFQYLSGGSLLGTPTTLGATTDIFEYNNYTRADFRAVEVVSSVPEPQTYAMMMAGLTFLAFAVRRKRKPNIG